MAGSRMAGLNLSDFDFSGIQTSGASQGDGGKLATAWESVRSKSPDYLGITGTGVATRANLKSAATQADADVYSSELMADAEVEAAKKAAAAQKSASKGSMFGSALGAVGSIGAALLSDETTKNDIQPLENALETLRNLKPVTFYYNEEYSSSPERLHHGFIAQDYVKVLPDATYYDEDLGKMCIDTGELIAILVRSVQQLEARVTYMEATKALQGATR
jgi:hypothetical protein